MKKICNLTVSLVLMCFLTCCGTSAPVASETGNESSGTENTVVSEESRKEEKEYYDDDFLADFSEAIQARWAISDRLNSGKVPTTKETLLRSR